MTTRHRYASGPATELLKQKLLLRIKQDQGDANLLAEDIIELIAIARNDHGGFSAATLELDRLLGFDMQRHTKTKMTETVTRPNGQPVTVMFNAGLPGPFDSPCIFLLDDGSIHAGEVVRNSKTFPAGALSTTNPAGGIHEKFEVPLGRVLGWADASPQDRNC